MKVIEKPWGHELLIVCNDRYALKDIHMIKGTRSSLQSHVHKLETIFVISGVISLERQAAGGEMQTEVFSAGQSYSIEPGTRHRVSVLQDARLIEASTPELDDVIRHADDFGRAAKPPE
jgi:mannose-6-phosphate isomerase-like protein (cupin superfamily)